MSINANYVATPKSPAILISTANTARDGSGTILSLYVAPASGARVDDISIQAIGTTTQGMIRLFLHNAVSAFLIKEIPVQAITPSATNASFGVLLTDLGIVLQSTHSLRVSTEKGESFHVVVTRGGDF